VAQFAQKQYSFLQKLKRPGEPLVYALVFSSEKYKYSLPVHSKKAGYIGPARIFTIIQLANSFTG